MSNRLSGPLPLFLTLDCDGEGTPREAEKTVARPEVGPRETLAFVPDGEIRREGNASVLCGIVRPKRMTMGVLSPLLSSGEG